MNFSSSTGLPAAIRDASDQPCFNTAAVVRLAGVPAATFRAWERRYGLPSPQRLPAGQRLYTERDAALIRWLHDQTNHGLTISRAIAIARDCLEDERSTHFEPAVGRPTAELVEDLSQALL